MKFLDMENLVWYDGPQVAAYLTNQDIVLLSVASDSAVFTKATDNVAGLSDSVPQPGLFHEDA